MVGETLALLEAVVKATETCPAADEVHRSHCLAEMWISSQEGSYLGS